MKTSAIACAVLAGTFGLGSVASAQGMGRGGDHGDRGDRGDRAEQRHDRNDDHRNGRWDGRRDDRRDDRGDRQGWRAGHQQPHYGYQQPQYHYQQPRYVYQQPSYRHSPRFYRGSYLPHEYRNRGYYVSNLQSHPGLYAPAYGQQWVNVDGEFLLVALATGLIANAILN